MLLLLWLWVYALSMCVYGSDFIFDKKYLNLMDLHVGKRDWAYLFRAH